VKSTITDVARRAGVSIKTVSRVLNNEPNVTDKTRDKVQDAVKALEYRPNFSARSLAGNRSYLLAMVYDNPSVEYITHMQKGATEACRQHGYHLVVEPVDWDNGDLTNDIEMLLGRLPVDGVILTPPVCDSRRIVSALEKARIPMVRICPRNPNMTSAPSLNMDDAALSVCGFDNTALASMIYPPLTTVSQPISDAGARAARVLIDRAGGTGDDREPQDIAVDYEIVIRGSTKTLSD